MAKKHPWLDEIVAVFDAIKRPLHLRELLDYIEQRGVIQQRSDRDKPYKSYDYSMMAALEQRSSDSDNHRKTNDLFYNAGGRGSRSGCWGLRPKDKLSAADAKFLEEIREENRYWQSRAKPIE